MYRIKNNEDGEFRNVTSLAGYDDDPAWEQVGPEMPEGADPFSIILVDGEWVADLSVLRARSWTQIKAARDAAQDGGCATALGRVDTDEVSRGKVSGAVQMAMIAQAAGVAFELTWTMADNTAVTHDAAAMIAMGVAVGQHVAACHAEGIARRAALDAAESAGAIEAVAVEGGWPGA